MSTTKKSKRQMRINEGKDFPDDFWNYYVNPILGYYYNNRPSERKNDR